MIALGPYDISCRELVEVVTDYLEGKLERDERTRFETHLCFCPPCRTYLAQIRDTVRASGRLTEARIPPDAREGLLQAFRGWKRGSGR